MVDKFFSGNESKVQPIEKLPKTIINFCISDFLKQSEIAYLSQSNRLFNQALSQALALKKAKVKRDYDDSVSINRLFSHVNPMHKMTVACQKAHALGNVITQFVNTEKSREYYTNYHDPNPYSKLILNHAYDLDKKNSMTSRLGRYQDNEDWSQYLPFLQVETHAGKDCFVIGGLEVTDNEVKYLAETFRKNYSTSLNVQSAKRGNYFYISFDLEFFLKDVLPVILGLIPKPILLPGPNQSHCCIS
jgi:hypothetical protein